MTGNEALAAIEVECEKFLKLHPDWTRDGRMIYHPNNMWSVSVAPIDKLDGSYYLCFRGRFHDDGDVVHLNCFCSKLEPSLERAFVLVKSCVQQKIKRLQFELDDVSKSPKEVTEDDGA